MADLLRRTGDRVETLLEGLLFHSRWLLAPIYIGLVASLLVLLYAFGDQLWKLVLDLSSPGSGQSVGHDLCPVSGPYDDNGLSPDDDNGLSPDKAILGILTLIDLSLAANLVLIIIFSGYENFVSRIDTGDSQDRPRWMGNIDFSGLKMRLIASIIAISAISLLRAFLELIQAECQAEVDLQVDRIRWLVITHAVFVLSGTMFAVMDWLGAATERTRKATPPAVPPASG